MPEIIRGIEQNSKEWFDLRLGSIGGSSIPAVLAKGKSGKPSKMRKDLMYTLAKEIITGKRDETYHSKDMDSGHEFEPKARALYEWERDVDVEQIAMIKSALPRVHVSPDGLVGEDGGIEIKKMKGKVFLEFLYTKTINTYHIYQCQDFLSVSGRTWIDYIVYCPEFDDTNEGVTIPKKFRGIKPLKVNRLYRDEDMIRLIETEVMEFLRELDEMLERLT